MIYSRLKKIIFPIWLFVYKLTVVLVYPINYILLLVLKNKSYPDSVLHISYMVHIPYYTVINLRKQGIKADYLAIGKSPVWNKYDFNIIPFKLPFIRVIQETYWFWKIIAKYEIIHSHFMITATYSGWEVRLLKKMGRKLVVHYRGCDIRDRNRNMELYPAVNVCQDCDYYHEHEKKYTCELIRIIKRRLLMRKYADLSLVTTPDLLEFTSNAIQFPFFTPEGNFLENKNNRNIEQKKYFKIVHATNHPGIEGTNEIRRCVDILRQNGHDINFVFLKGVSYERIIEEYRNADLSIGKMKMGYYANAQIESMYYGVPAITYIRSEYYTEELLNSGFIITDFKNLLKTLEYYLLHPDELEKKRIIAKESILKLHNNDKLSKRLIELYQNI